MDTSAELVARRPWGKPQRHLVGVAAVLLLVPESHDVGVNGSQKKFSYLVESVSSRSAEISPEKKGRKGPDEWTGVELAVLPSPKVGPWSNYLLRSPRNLTDSPTTRYRQTIIIQKLQSDFIDGSRGKKRQTAPSAVVMRQLLD